ncbi:hypothetical protein SI65_03789 [Aspergillus cristatus]|uniref:SET domain-containing protein n=1 Tax=Aspergillus cristatus TaxID=573508 RepID=A0A1E3BK45_ASPCR|nr:hypothetical protein SI65_03789 [Aspergillus cristatus]
MANINRETVRILAAIYYDINSVCDIRKRVNSNPKDEDTNDYRTACRRASTLVSRAVTQALRHQFSNQRHYDQRLTELTTRLGWKLLSICAHSAAFRQATIRAGVVTWDVLISQLEANRLSIELFARTRNLEWRGPLLKHARHNLPELQKELAPYIKLYDQHPHHFVRTENKAVRMPVYEEFLQMHIDACMFDPRQWKSYVEEGDVYDPTQREEEDGNCWICRQSLDFPCSCLPPDVGQLVELVDYPKKGIGVRALANFKEGQILGEFIGEVRHWNYGGDPKYSYLIHDKYFQPVATISPKRYGNWTRFINHSCGSSTKFDTMAIGKRLVVVIRAKRDIMMFEEITVHYGGNYWEGRTCECGSSKCKSRKPESEESPLEISVDNDQLHDT